jgi:Sec-independent protein translocase protein TatA
MGDPTTWRDVGIECAKQLPNTLVALGGLVWAFRRYVKPAIQKIDKKQDVAIENQKRIEDKADGNHARALESVKETSRYTSDQIIKAVEKVLAAQAPHRASKRSTDPEPTEAQVPKRGRRSTDKKEPDS